MADWIIVVDDDISNLKVAGRILSRHGMRVTALNSGQALLDYADKNGSPDLILLDINMPGMDGFETFVRYRQFEEKKNLSQIPIIFLTADEDSANERKGFDMGVADYIRKPFNPDILIRRVENILNTHGQMQKYEEQATLDRLTGFLNKAAASDRIEQLCESTKGCLCVIDLDSFKPVNDIYGHDTGDRVLTAFAEIMRNELNGDGVFGRIGGDEFMIFSETLKDEAAVKNYATNINTEMLKVAKNIMGDEMSIPIGASVGAVMVPQEGRDFQEIFRIADRMLYIVKNDGKHGAVLYSESKHGNEDNNYVGMDLKTLTHILEERDTPQSAMWMGREAFGNIYRYMIRYMDRYQGTAYKILLTAEIESDNYTAAEKTILLDKVRELLQNSLRNSDVMMQIGENHFFLLLPEINSYNVERVVERIDRALEKDGYSGVVKLKVESESVNTNVGDNPLKKNKGVDRIVVVDDDMANLTLVGNILSKNNIHVTALRNGKDFLAYMKDNEADLILMDVKMPDMDGFETLTKLKEEGNFRTPVVFMTSDEDEETETKGLELGATDFIRKPIAPGSLVLRVKHILELILLQNHLTSEVERKTEEIEGLSINIVKALAEAIDAKDTYTNGHSGRVADYSREIARRYGYPADKIDDIYVMGLLHDVGKIGVPDAVINKPSRLTDEEYGLIKNHPVMGAKILKNIKEMPQLSSGARWHHERFDGTGYPDGLKGTEIPIEARIIAVADSYDAMTSRRSYRDPLSQDVVRRELINGKGTQFDPALADIMIAMIDEDIEYLMRES